MYNARASQERLLEHGLTKAGPGRAAPPREPGVVPARGSAYLFIKAEEGSSRAGVKGLTFKRQDKQDRHIASGEAVRTAAESEVALGGPVVAGPCVRSGRARACAVADVGKLRFE